MFRSAERIGAALFYGAVGVAIGLAVLYGITHVLKTRAGRLGAAVGDTVEIYTQPH